VSDHQLDRDREANEASGESEKETLALKAVGRFKSKLFTGKTSAQ